MIQFLVILVLSVLLVGLAILGLAVKSFFKKGNHQLSTCGGAGKGNSCGCGAQASCDGETTPARRSF